MAGYGSYAGGGSYLDAVQDEMGYGTAGTDRSSFGGYGTYLDGSYGRGLAEARRAQDAGGSRISIKDAFDLVKTVADVKDRRDRLEFDREQHKENVRSAQALEKYNADALAETKRHNQESEKHNQDSLALSRSVHAETTRHNQETEANNAKTSQLLKEAQDFEIGMKKDELKRRENENFLLASRGLFEKNPSFTSWLNNDIELSYEEEGNIKDLEARAKAGRMATFIKVLSGGKLTPAEIQRANIAFGFDGKDEWFDGVEVDKDGNAALMAYMFDKKTGKQVRVAYPFNEESYTDVVDSAIALYQTHPDLTRKILDSLPEDIRRDAIGNINARGEEQRINRERKHNLERDQSRSNQAFTIAKVNAIDKYIEELQDQEGEAKSSEDVAKIKSEIQRLEQMKREALGITQSSASGGGTGATPSTSKTTVLAEPVAETNGLGKFSIP